MFYKYKLLLGIVEDHSNLLVFMELCIALVKFIYIGLHRASSGQTGVRIVEHA